MKIIASLLIIVIIAVFGCLAWDMLRDRSFDGKPETQLQREIRQTKQANEAFAQAITNDVVGWHRTIKSFAMVGSGPMSNWWAEATVEFVNKVGGIERADLRWGFEPGMDRSVYALQLTPQQFSEMLQRK